MLPTAQEHMVVKVFAQRLLIDVHNQSRGEEFSYARTSQRRTLDVVPLGFYARIPEAGAEFGSSARTNLCGGQVTAFTTATTDCTSLEDEMRIFQPDAASKACIK